MSELIFIKRGSKSKLRTFNKPVIKLELNCGRFIISDVAAKLLELDDNDGVMFAFNQKEKTAYIIKDNEDDAFILQRKDKNVLRFSSKNLTEYFADTFDLYESGKASFVFNIEEKANEKGMRKLTL